MLPSNRNVIVCALILLVILSVSPLSAGKGLFFSPAECVKRIQNVEGCADAITAILRWDFSHLKHGCCDVLEGLTEDCWPIVFPHQPLVHTMIKGICFFPIETTVSSIINQLL
ncbi:unnamed protein product [Brassica oleracea]